MFLSHDVTHWNCVLLTFQKYRSSFVPICDSYIHGMRREGSNNSREPTIAYAYVRYSN